MHSISDISRPLNEIIDDLKHAPLLRELNQKSIAKACNLNQSQVSRLLSGRCQRITKGLEKLCIYASVEIFETSNYDPSKDVPLMGALRIAIKNNPSRARQIERIMYALAEE